MNTIHILNCSFVVISLCSNLSTSLRKSTPRSRTDYGCDALFLFAFFNCDVKIIIRISVIFVFS